MTANPAPLVLLDCDATTIEEEVVELIAQLASSHEEIQRITELAMQGKIDFAESLQQRVATFAGLSTEVFSQVAQQVTFTPGFFDLVDAVHRLGGKIGVISGGFTQVLDIFLPPTGVDLWRANLLEVRDGILTGHIEGPIIDAAAKRETLKEWAARFGIPMEQTFAIGDGANDLLMLGEAAHSIGFRPKSIVAERVDHVFSRSLAELIPLLEG